MIRAEENIAKRFNERTQAFLIVCWGRELKDRFGKRGEEAFRFAARCYGEGRGRRMAQRAIRDGEALDLASYIRYKEWKNTDEILAKGEANRAKVLEKGERYVKEVSLCPWYLQFRDMDALPIGDLYCRTIDRSIAAGFSTAFSYEVIQNLNQGVPCLHVVEKADLPENIGPVKEEYMRPFDYHCADLHHAFCRAAKTIFEAEGQKLRTAVEDAFLARYGEEMAKHLRQMTEKEDFTS